MAKRRGQNTGFFHRMANSHRRRNNIFKLKINGVWNNEKEEFRQGIMNAYKTLLSDPEEWRASPDGLDFSRLAKSDTAKMEVPFSEEEVSATLKHLNGDKAPGLDGFTTAF